MSHRFLIHEEVFLFGRPLLSGWDINKVNGSIEGNAYENFVISDEVVLRRKFDRQSEEKVTLETAIQFVQKSEGFSFLLGGMGLIAKDGNLCFSDGSVLLNYRTGVFYNVRMVFDYNTNIVEININDEKFCLNCDLCPMDELIIETKKESKVSVMFVRLYTGYVLFERFHTTPLGCMPVDWEVEKDSRAKVCIGELNNMPYTDSRYMAIEDCRSSATTVSRKFEAQKGKFSFWFKFFLPYVYPADKFGPTFSFSGNGKEIFAFNPRAEGIYANGKSIYEYKTTESLWNQVFIDFDVKTGKVYLRINGKEPIELDFFENEKSVDKFTIKTVGGGWTRVWLADMIVAENKPEPEDYPSEPVIPKKVGDYTIGMQCCNMWREGMHLGWDVIEPYPDRRTYLGYYAEGNPEVSDWEIKWQTEHGVDFQLWCWYPADAYRGGPVRVLPVTEQAMHYGYFNAKYRDKLKFALNYNPSGPLSTEEFRQNIVPFWIEYYFTNENYVVIDNKPVYMSLGILGETPEEAKANVDFVDEQCKLAGFDGAIYIGTCAHQQAHIIQGVKDAGAEVIANYTWGYTCCIEGEQENWMTQQRLANAVSVIPTISMGYNNDAWITSGRGGFTTPEMFKNLLLWAKNEHMPHYESNDIASKMVLLDNWNEYGEGHYIMPSGIHGFGYLQAVREVFTVNGEYTPERPTNEALLRMQELYPKGRKALKTVKAAPKFPSKVLKGWYFDNPEDVALWKCKSGIDNFRAEDGLLKGDANCNEPILYLDDDFGIDMTECPYIRVTERLSNAEFMHFFLRGKNEKGEREEVHHYISIKGMETAYGASKLKGVFSDFEFVPVNSPGAFELKAIELMGYDSIPVKYSFEGNVETFFAEPFFENGVLYAPITQMEEKLGVSLYWDFEKDAIILTLKNGVDLVYRGGGYKIIDRIAYFPIISLCERLGFKAVFDEITQTVIITNVR